MIDLSELRVGDRVQVVDDWGGGCGQNKNGLMDHWLGQIVTVSEINGSFITIEEDAGEATFKQNGHWSWNARMFDRIVNDEEEVAAYFVATDMDVSQLLGL